jgi:hypothetical protein
MIDNYWYFSSYEYLFEFFNFFVSFSSAYNQSFEALMVVLMPTIACIMDKSVVEISESYVETCSIYAILVGYPSVKISVVLNLIKDAFISSMNEVNLLMKIEVAPTVKIMI